MYRTIAPFTPTPRPEGSAFGTGSRPTWAEVQLARRAHEQARANARYLGSRARGPFRAALGAVAGLVALLTGTVRG
jgi:hypothetical protein